MGTSHDVHYTIACSACPSTLSQTVRLQFEETYLRVHGCPSCESGSRVHLTAACSHCSAVYSLTLDFRGSPSIELVSYPCHCRFESTGMTVLNRIPLFHVLSD